MNLSSKRDIKKLLKKYRIRPSKKLGQNFLIDKKAVEKIIDAANLEPEDIVLEIGPGIGFLTQGLAKKIKKLVAVEKDQKMMEILKETLVNFKNVEKVKDDILKIKHKNYNLKPREYKIAANLPFYLTAPVIRKFLESEIPPKEMILAVQKEMGQRICAKPPKMSILAVSVQLYAKAEIAGYLSKESFWPKPKVDSAIIKITPKPSNNKSLNKIMTDRSLFYYDGFREFKRFKEIKGVRGFKDLFFFVVKTGFSQPRKQLINNLSRGLKLEREKVEKWLLENKIQPKQRAETLTVENWITLTKSMPRG